MQERIVKAAAELPGRIGLYVHDLATGEKLVFQPDVAVNAASVIKLTVMMEAFRQREAGELDFEADVVIRREDKLPSCGALSYMHDGLKVQVRDLVTLMIILSDNTATNLLIDILGMEKINRGIRNAGLAGTVMRRKLFDEVLSGQGIQNQVTAGDMGMLLEKMEEGTLVSPGASREMLEILGNQRLNGKIPFYLHGKGIPCAHKTGEDDGITHDVGIIYGEHPVVFCFVSEQTDVPAAERFIQDAARMCILSE